VVPDRFASGAPGEILVGPAGLTDELEAELAVTRICDSILGRLGELEAHEGTAEATDRLITSPTSSTSGASEDRNRPTPPVAGEETRQWILQRLREVMEIAMG
jgi:hypothetical protein